jgi:hypothetical protein
LLGNDHPETLAAANNLANTLAALEELNGALILGEEVLKTSRRVRGASHPDTARAAGNLANTLSALNDWAGAQILEEEVVATFRRGLGSDHPDTLRALFGVAPVSWTVDQAAAVAERYLLSNPRG